MNRYRQGRMDQSVLEQLVLQVPAAGSSFRLLLSGRDSDQRRLPDGCTSFIFWPRAGSASTPTRGPWTIKPLSFPEVSFHGTRSTRCGHPVARRRADLAGRPPVSARSLCGPGCPVPGGAGVLPDRRFSRNMPKAGCGLPATIPSGRPRGPQDPAPGPFRTSASANGNSSQRRWHALEPLTKLLGLPTESDYALRSEDLQREGIACSARTLRRYYRAWQRAGKDRLALLSRADRRGARGRPRRNSWLHKHPQVKRLVEEAIGTVYLNKARRPIAAVTRRVLDDLQRMNARLPAAQAIPVPREAALARAIARWIAQMDPWEVDRERWGRRIADMRHAPKKPQQLATPDSPAGGDRPHPAQGRGGHGGRPHRPTLADDPHRLLQPAGGRFLPGL